MHAWVGPSTADCIIRNSAWLFTPTIPALPIPSEAAADNFQSLESPLQNPESADGTRHSLTQVSLRTTLVMAAIIIQHRFPGMGSRMIQSLCECFIKCGEESAIPWAHDMALSFARMQPDAAHEVYARKLEQRVAHRRLAKEACQESTTLKWDSGICEWLDGTPLAKQSSGLQVHATQLLEDTAPVVDPVTPCKRGANVAGLDGADDIASDDEDELNRPQSGTRGMGEVVNARWYGWKTSKRRPR
ncbi:MAG: hypothetical protein Q9162_004715 [Coniocarpon cinnabarinum]